MKKPFLSQSLTVLQEIREGLGRAMQTPRWNYLQAISLRGVGPIYAVFVMQCKTAAWVMLSLTFLVSEISDAQERPIPITGDNSVHFAWADVLRVDPLFDYVPVTNPAEECPEVRADQRSTPDSGGSTTLGAVIGGALGNTVGKGNGREAATIAGAIIGGAVGHQAGKEKQPDRVTETRCRRVKGGYEQRRIIGYDIEYRYRGEIYMSRLSYDPGDRLRVRVSVTPAE